MSKKLTELQEQFNVKRAEAEVLANSEKAEERESAGEVIAELKDLKADIDQAKELEGLKNYAAAFNESFQPLKQHINTIIKHRHIGHS